MPKANKCVSDSFLFIVGTTSIKQLVPQKTKTVFPLRELQTIIGGNIQVLGECEMFDEPMFIIGDEDAKLKRLARNYYAEEMSMINGNLYGNILFCHQNSFE
jgi:hypothetical protein